jgi:hypothetical protein
MAEGSVHSAELGLLVQQLVLQQQPKMHLPPPAVSWQVLVFLTK